MPRNPADSTRFTATSPHAHSKPSTTTATTIDIGTAPPPNETPAQKVARLREAARKAKMGSETTWDKVVNRGRVWADRAHKVTATGLIGLSVIATGFALLSLGDMMLTNRRKKTSWIAEQQSNYDRALSLARQAESNGTLTDDLRMFLVKEHAIELAEKEQKERGGVLERVKKTVFEGYSKEEKAGGRLSEMLTREDRARRVSNEEMARITSDPADATLSTRNQELARESAVREARDEASKEAVGAARPSGGSEGGLQREADPSKQYNKSNVMPANTIARTTLVLGTTGGGYLDQLAANSASAILNSARGWTGRKD